MHDHNWQDAFDRCLMMGAEIVTIGSDSENNYVASLIPTNDGMRVWIEATSSGYTNWNTGEPNNQNNEEDKIQMYGDFHVKGKWNDLSSWSKLNGIVCAYEH